jgi:hypothetical protein
MGKVERIMYVVYPTALFDGWEVVKERDDEPVRFDTQGEAIADAKARAAMDGGAIVRLENWYGDIEGTFEAHAQPGRHFARMR